MKILGRMIVLGLVAATPLLLAAAVPTPEGPVTYSVTFVPTWNPATHPLEYPITHAKGGLLTPMIGATHGSRYRIFEAGKRPTPGLEALSEMGKHDPLDAEIREAIARGGAGSLIELTEGAPGPVHAPVTYSFEVDSRHPLVSLVGMIAPSPDWFYGVSGVPLQKRGRWMPEVTVDAFAWDSGGDAGKTYLDEDRDIPSKEPTRSAMTAHFRRNGKPVPVGKFVFKMVPSLD